MLKVDTKGMGKLLNSFQTHPSSLMVKDRATVFYFSPKHAHFAAMTSASNFFTDSLKNGTKMTGGV